MKVVHITTSPRGGAGIAAFRLYEAQRVAGMATAYISNSLTHQFNGVKVQDPMFEYHKPSIAKRVLSKIEKTLNPSESDILSRKLAGMESELNYEILTTPFSNVKLEEHPLVLEADLIHLHWVGSILDYPRFFKHVNKPIVWTLHDMNPFKGLFHYKDDELNNEIAMSLDKQVKEIKQKAIGNILKGAVVTPSEWLLNEADKSAVFNSFGIKQTIPNSINVSLYENIDRDKVREKLGLNRSEKVLLFTSALLNIRRKGLDLLLGALENLSQPIKVLTLGKGSLEIANKNVKVIPLGYMSDDVEIANCYMAADAFVLPSREDNLPNTMLESLAAGTPVICFATGGMKEHITTGVNGILIIEMSSAKLGEGIDDILNDRYVFNANKIRDYARDQFGADRQVEAYSKIYNQLIT